MLGGELSLQPVDKVILSGSLRFPMLTWPTGHEPTRGSSHDDQCEGSLLQALDKSLVLRAELQRRRISCLITKMLLFFSIRTIKLLFFSILLLP